jgi:hypothetical protein
LTSSGLLCCRNTAFTKPSDPTAGLMGPLPRA